MIVCTTQPLYRYSGLSTDIKPTKDVKDASTFWETDTGKEYEWRKDAWIQTNNVITLIGVTFIDEDVFYVCKAAKGSLLTQPVWQIQKIDASADIIYQWCNGNDLFVNEAMTLEMVRDYNYS